MKENTLTQRNSPQPQRPPTVLCILDHVLCNLTIHYSQTMVLRHDQGLRELTKLVRQDRFDLSRIRLVYLLAGRADAHLPPATFGRVLEDLLQAFQRKAPRIMILVCAVLMVVSDSDKDRLAIREINLKMAKIADKDPHWQFCNPNSVLALAGNPQKRFFSDTGLIQNNGCMTLAKVIVAASKNARMQKNFDLLRPWSLDSVI